MLNTQSCSKMNDQLPYYYSIVSIFALILEQFRSCNNSMISKHQSHLNIVPSNLIKCTQCNSYVRYEELSTHTSLHIPVKYTSSLLKQNEGLGKHNFNKYLEDDEQTEVDVKSVLPEQIPNSQKIRKQMPNTILGEYLSCNMKPTFLSIDARIDSQRPEKLVIQSLEKEIQEEKVMINIQNLQRKLNVKKRITFKQDQIKIGSKEIKLYSNQRPQEIGRCLDQNVIHRKLKREQQEEQKDGYQIEPQLPQDKRSQTITIQLKTKKKTPADNYKIATKSTTSSWYNKERKNQEPEDCNTEQDEQKQLNLRLRELQCQQCKGFYCKSCGSDIPPIYRPTKIRIGPTESQARQFYQKNMYRHFSGKTSRATGCTNCQ